MSLRKVFPVAIFAISLVAGTAVAQSPAPRDIDDLVGRKMKNAKSELRNRGYVRIEKTRAGDRNYQQWWNDRTSTCGMLQVQDGRIRTIVEAPAFDCNQDDDNWNQSSGRNQSSTPFYADGSAAHRSHHHSNGQHSGSRFDEDEFERGHRDALHNHHYDNYNGTDAYNAGFESGADQRHHNTSYRQQSNRNDRGYRPAHSNAEIERLSGGQASSVDGTLRNWGFKDVDGFTSGNSKYTIWYNWSTGQCLQMTTADGKAVDVRDIGFNEHCN